MKLTNIKSSSIGKIFLGNFVIQITTILQTIVLARVLGPEGKGLFTEAILWPTVIAGFSILGLYTGIVKCTAKDILFEKYDFYKATIILTTFVGIVGMMISIIYSSFIYKDNDVLLRLCLVFSPYVLANNIARGFVAIDHGRRDFKSYSITRAILNPIFLSLILILFIYNNLTVTTVVLSYLTANIFVAGLRVFLGLRKRETHKSSVSPSWLLKYSLRYAPSDFSEPIYAYFDKIIVALVLTSYDLGIYTVAFSTAALISIIPNVYSTKLFSDVAAGDSMESAIALLRQNTLLMIAGGILLAVCIPFIVPFAVGNKYNDAIVPAIVLLLVSCLQGQSLILERAILAKGFPFVGIIAKTLTMSLFAAIAIIIKLQNIESIYAVIIANIVTQFFYLLYLSFKIRSLFNVNVALIPTKSDFSNIYKSFKNL